MRDAGAADEDSSSARASSACSLATPAAEALFEV
jgi:hypothetical protein